MKNIPKKPTQAHLPSRWFGISSWKVSQYKLFLYFQCESFFIHKIIFIFQVGDRSHQVRKQIHWDLSSLSDLAKKVTHRNMTPIDFQYFIFLMLSVTHMKSPILNFEEVLSQRKLYLIIVLLDEQCAHFSLKFNAIQFCFHQCIPLRHFSES